MKHDPTFWLLARASGMTAYVLADALRARRPRAEVATVRRAFGPRTVTQIHRALALNAIAAIAAHGIALVLDTTVKVSPSRSRSRD